MALDEPARARHGQQRSLRRIRQVFSWRGRVRRESFAGRAEPGADPAEAPPARSRARDALAPLFGWGKVRTVVIEYHVPKVPDRKLQLADGLLDFRGPIVITHQPCHGFEGQSRREQPTHHDVVHGLGDLVAIRRQAQSPLRRPGHPPSGGSRVGRTAASTPSITPQELRRTSLRHLGSHLAVTGRAVIVQSHTVPAPVQWPGAGLFADTSYSERTPASSAWPSSGRPRSSCCARRGRTGPPARSAATSRRGRGLGRDAGPGLCWCRSAGSHPRAGGPPRALAATKIKFRQWSSQPTSPRFSPPSSPGLPGHAGRCGIRDVGFDGSFALAAGCGGDGTAR